MNCPGCDAEPPDAPANEEHPRVCGACGGVWMNVSDLNRLLLHDGLPGIQSLRARRVKDGRGAVCRSCGVDLTCFEGGERDASRYYELCEDCGCLFVELESPPPDVGAAERGLAAFFRGFMASRNEGMP